MDPASSAMTMDLVRMRSEEVIRATHGWRYWRDDAPSNYGVGGDGNGDDIDLDGPSPVTTLLGVVQCRGPNGRRPGIIATDGSIWSHHDAQWPRPEHRTGILRVLP